jgi:hypothetical protein
MLARMVQSATEQPPTERPVLRRRQRLRSSLTVARVIEALNASFGLIAPSAARLGVDRSDLRRFCREHPRCLAALAEGRSDLLDRARQGLTKRVFAGDAKAEDKVLDALDPHFRGPGRSRPITDDGDYGDGPCYIRAVVVQPIKSGTFVLPPGFDGPVPPHLKLVVSNDPPIIDVEPDKPA